MMAVSGITCHNPETAAFANSRERCTRAPFRKIARDINEEARDHARALKDTPEFEQSSDERKKVEMRFAHLKTHHRFERMRLRGSPARATSSTSRPSRRTLRRLQTTSGDHHRTCRLPASRECHLRQASVGSVNVIPLQPERSEMRSKLRAKAPIQSLNPLIGDFINTIDPEQKSANQRFAC